MASVDLQRLIPAMAKEAGAEALVRLKAKAIKTSHRLVLGSATQLDTIPDGSVQLCLNSPPYWNLKEYGECDGQLGNLESFKEFCRQLEQCWKEAYRVLAPGGRMCVVVGDVVVGRKSVFGRHKSFPLHAAIQLSCENVGFDALTPILWHKIANAAFEAGGNHGSMLGKPYEPNGIVKSDTEFILLFRKPGGYRQVEDERRLASLIPADLHRAWFTQVWSDVQGAHGVDHPAPYPVALAERLVRMFSFVGDTVLDNFLGSGSSVLAAAAWGRNSIGVDIEPRYVKLAAERLRQFLAKEGLHAAVEIQKAPRRKKPVPQAFPLVVPLLAKAV